ncbi:DUF4253 domain-containing protein [Ottowia testudinis]|uniref:DUF4253 domain-containing protein n=1 Tax=Ottowia testudinis TaxID=2816950 RepID=A0A975H4D0_9BURK|nr:DUF4253 domain-containing protein [Ottowia testudinis]QTD46729.1 DUF4253 domain-containing protein [Ottowia testudinis]
MAAGSGEGVAVSSPTRQELMPFVSALVRTRRLALLVMALHLLWWTLWLAGAPLGVKASMALWVVWGLAGWLGWLMLGSKSDAARTSAKRLLLTVAVWVPGVSLVAAALFRVITRPEERLLDHLDLEPTFWGVRTKLEPSPVRRQADMQTLNAMAQRLHAAAREHAAAISPLRPWATTWIDGDPVQSRDAHSFLVETVEALPCAQHLQGELHLGYRVFAGYADPDDEGKTEIVVMRGTTAMDPIRFARTDPVNQGLSNDDLVRLMLPLQKQYGFTVVAANLDSVVLRFLKLPDPLEPLVAALQVICPDAMHDWPLVRQLKDEGTVRLWWD